MPPLLCCSRSCMLNRRTYGPSRPCFRELPRKGTKTKSETSFLQFLRTGKCRAAIWGSQQARNNRCKEKLVGSCWCGCSLGALEVVLSIPRWASGSPRFRLTILRPKGCHGYVFERSRLSERTKVPAQTTDEGREGGEGGHSGCSGGGGGGCRPGSSGSSSNEDDGQGGSVNFELLAQILTKWLECFGHRTALTFLISSVAVAGMILLLNCSAKVSSASALTPEASFQQFSRQSVHPTEEQRAKSKNNCSSFVWEVERGHWTRFYVNTETDEFSPDDIKGSEQDALSYSSRHFNFKSESSLHQKNEGNYSLRKQSDLLQKVNAKMDDGFRFLKQWMLPEGYPQCVTEDYMEYTLWRMGQIIANQISGVLTTQALLYAVGLGKGAIPTAAAVNWVLRDGIGYISKIALSKYGRHFDVHPKGWRLFADILENCSNGLELLTPLFPHLFVFLGATAGAGRSAAGLVQAATRSCFYAGFAAQHNFAEVIAKGEAQGMVGKSLGIALGLGISSHVGASRPLLLVTFVVVTAFHVVCNMKSYQAIQLHTLNTYRASLLMAEYLHSGKVLSVKDVNAQEPIFAQRCFPHIEIFNGQGMKQCLVRKPKDVAADIEQNLDLGATLNSLVKTKPDTLLLDLYRNEQYIMLPVEGKFKVLLKETASSHDLLRVVLQVSYLHQSLNQQNDLERDCNKEEYLRKSYNLMKESFELLKQDLEKAGWVADGLIARPGSHRLLDPMAKIVV